MCSYKVHSDSNLSQNLSLIVNHTCFYFAWDIENWLKGHYAGLEFSLFWNREGWSNHVDWLLEMKPFGIPVLMFSEIVDLICLGMRQWIILLYRDILSWERDAFLRRSQWGPHAVGSRSLSSSSHLLESWYSSFVAYALLQAATNSTVTCTV